jgi:Leucine-rich repeat (LRR) protein
MNNKELFINLVKKIEYSELEFYFEGNEKNDKENELYLHDPKTGEKIYLFTLWIDNINLKDCGKLESLDLRNNKLSQLDLDNKSKLTDLDCSHNFISELRVKHLSELKLLHRYYNNLLSLDCSNLKNLKDLNCHNNDENLKEQFKKAFVPRLEKHVQELITNYSETKRSQFLTEINSLTPFFIFIKFRN